MKNVSQYSYLSPVGLLKKTGGSIDLSLLRDTQLGADVCEFFCWIVLNEHG